jgi:hypothetical protein
MFCIGERDMASAGRKNLNPAMSPDVAEEMAKYGIKRVPVDYFHYREFRYTNLEDAVAQAKRDQSPNALSPTSSPRTSEEMAKYGIKRVPVDYFHYREFRYTNLEDAVAQAKRQQRKN